MCAACVIAGSAPFAVHAEICEYENINGKKLYTNVTPGSGWTKQNCIKIDPPPKSNDTKTVAPRSNLPKVTSEQQKQRDAMRRQVLEEELATETKLLTETKNALLIGLAPTSAEEIKDTRRYQERLTHLKDTVSLHERNVDALKKEIAKIK
ncbi:MAG: DUF4124 domain-containing protein [Burkholderiales bacterium]|jgi:hypothetical protein|nr:DUF4124 domain-containing protein [Burkholderiales bacterium]